ncbi:cell division protein SepF [Rhizohabitans arisaemae]|uniref:cell division protein SepF n=1 Tax=Rhizohabitans arisaemae TaxID=2720610 RepID=UPI0024B0B2D3|nr:cell division protein SepF [Rhizohabitans arisaemae]
MGNTMRSLATYLGIADDVPYGDDEIEDLDEGVDGDWPDEPAELTQIVTLQPRTYNDAVSIGHHFRNGIPVIMDLSRMADEDAKRLVDFAAGLIFGCRGGIDRVATKVFLLSPPNVEVTTDARH